MNLEIGPALYAAGKRMLIPLGLHHVFYPPFLFEFGEYVNAAGQVLKGESARYFGGDPNAGKFMASEFPLMLFGLPMAALAMYMRAKPQNRKAVGGMMLSAALTSIITGITEPIEFAFIFVAPWLYVLHVALAFVSGTLTSLLDIHLGYTFSASAIDWVLGYFNQKNSAMLAFVVGPIMGLLYFTSFYYLIGKFNLRTPGREDSSDATADKELTSNSTLRVKASAILKALGGAKNLKELDACITRLRIPDPTFADKILGDGFAIDPTSNVITAPCDGVVMHVFPTGHAVAMQTAEGLEILIHVGIDTVKMKGEGFKALVKKLAKSSITPFVITNMDKVKSMRVNDTDPAAVLEIVLK